jgi:hypothetical protein
MSRQSNDIQWNDHNRKNKFTGEKETFKICEIVPQGENPKNKGLLFWV